MWPHSDVSRSRCGRGGATWADTAPGPSREGPGAVVVVWSGRRESNPRILLGKQAGRAYAEAEVNDLLRPAHEDVATLRRELVDYGFLARADGVYRLADAGPDLDPRFAVDLPVDLERRLREIRAGR